MNEPASPATPTLYMIIEHFKNGDALPVYRRFRESGRMLPPGLRYVASWVDDRFERCFQLMETQDVALLREWIEKWNDLIDFDIHVVLTSEEAAARITAHLTPSTRQN